MSDNPDIELARGLFHDDKEKGLKKSGEHTGMSPREKDKLTDLYEPVLKDNPNCFSFDPKTGIGIIKRVNPKNGEDIEVRFDASTAKGQESIALLIGLKESLIAQRK